MEISRRNLMATALTAAAFGGLHKLANARPPLPASDPGYFNEFPAYGPLIEDPNGLVDLPKGFSYTTFSKMGEVMDDGLLVPGVHDGMAAFAHPNNSDIVILVRNHEIRGSANKYGAFGPKGERLTPELAKKLYASTPEGMPLGGGTTTVYYDLKQKKCVKHFLSLAGTSTNCAGGDTPWGSWLTCEETELRQGKSTTKDHGYVFEVPALATGLVDPVPLKAMGRFSHEACVVDPQSGAVYMTEDDHDGCLYRFLPTVKGQLAKGGKLQALKIDSAPKAHTNNRGAFKIKEGQKLSISWVDLDDVENVETVVRKQALEKGCALFARGEGMTITKNQFYFTATSGGPLEMGQVFRYTLSPLEATKDEATKPAILELFYESDDLRVFDYGDNVTITPQGNILVCEDRYSDVLRNHLRLITPEGKVATFAAVRTKSNTEFAGACYSPDGSTLFVNLQYDGITLAITGPWDQMKL